MISVNSKNHSTTSTQRIRALLDKCGNYDKDERYMATADLLTELQENIRIDFSLERRICVTILKQLDDSSNDVQTIAVKSLQTLVGKFEQPHVSDICNKLIALILSGPAELRDIYSIGLKTVLENIPPSMGSSIANQLVGRLKSGIDDSQQTDSTVVLECLDILTTLIKLYGNHCASEHAQISYLLLKQLDSTESSNCKRAASCLGQLTTVVCDEVLDDIVNKLLSRIEGDSAEVHKQTVIQTVGMISRMVGHRLGSHIDHIVPLFLAALGNPMDTSLQNESSDDLRENILHALQSFVTHCPQEVHKRFNQVLPLLLQFLQYDPNYNYDSIDDNEDDIEPFYDYDDEFDEEYSDDDDTSWKVRRSSVKVLRAIVGSPFNWPESIYSHCANPLLTRFCERDECVKLDILACYSELIDLAVIDQRKTSIGKEQILEAVHSSQNEINRQEEIRQAAIDDIPRAIKMSSKIFDEKSVKAKVAVFRMLSTLTRVFPGKLNAHMHTLLPNILKCCDPSLESPLVCETLGFVRQLLETHSPADMKKIAISLCPQVIACVGTDWYKVVAEALLTLQVLVSILRPLSNLRMGEDVDMIVDEQPNLVDAESLVHRCYYAVYPRLITHDIDVEIKSNAVSGMAALFFHFGDCLTDKLDNFFEILLNRLENETMRFSALKGLEKVIVSPLILDISGTAPRIVNTLLPFFRQQSRTLKQHTLSTLIELIKSLHRQNRFENLLPKCPDMIECASKLIAKSDLHLTQMSLELIFLVVRACGNMVDAAILIRERVIPPCKQLLSDNSVLLGNTALEAMQTLFGELARLDSKELRPSLLLGWLLTPAEMSDEPSGSCLESLAKCVAAIVLASEDIHFRNYEISNILTSLQRSRGDGSSANAIVALLSLGEIGGEADLGASSGEAFQKVLACTESSGLNEEIKAAAAVSLGSIVLGNMNVYLPILCANLQNHELKSHQYLLLCSFRECIVRYSMKKEDQTPPLPIANILPVLESCALNEEEGVRNVVAECLGKLAECYPSVMFPYLLKVVSNSGEPLVRWTSITSLKYVCMDENPDVALSLGQNIEAFVHFVSDSDLHVSRAAVVSFNSISHNQPSLLREIAADKLIPLLFERAALDDRLKHSVDLGPFKHVIDDGLPLRKSAYSCLLTMVEVMPESIPLQSILEQVKFGLKDVDDVATICHQLIAQLAIRDPELLLKNCDDIVNALGDAFRKAPRSQGNDASHQTDVIRSAMRAIDALNSIPALSQHQSLIQAISTISQTPYLRSLADCINISFG